MQNQEITGDGNCVAQGIGNTVVCPPTARSFGSVELESHRIVTAYFNGAPEELPVPPDYPLDQAQAHCDDWRDWFTDNPKIFSGGGGFLLQMTAGTNDLVVVKNVYANIFKRTLAANGTTIKCLYGGGSNAGVDVKVNTLTQRTTFVPFDSSETIAMPPGSLTLGLDDSGYFSAAISLTSNDGFLYEGQLVVEALVNNEPKTIKWGSPEKPFRWISDEGGRFTAPLGEEYDWNPIEKRWVKGLDPFSLTG